MTERVLLAGRISPELKALVDVDKRDNQDVLEAALASEFGGERDPAIEREIREKEERIEMLQKEIDARVDEIEEMGRDIRKLKKQQEQKEAAKEEIWQEAIGALSGRLLTTDMQPVQHWAEVLDVEPSEVIQRVQDAEDDS